MISSIDLNGVSSWYIKHICSSDQFLSPVPVSDSGLLYPPFRTLIEAAIKQYEEVNIDNDCPYMYETYRSHILQNAYFFRGASKIRGGSILTAGMHHFGVAVDIINLVDKNGNKIKDKGESVDWTNLDYKTMRNITRKMNISDLGNYEVCHFQYIPVSMQSELRELVFGAVKKFQSSCGLVPDGIVGPKTLGVIRKTYN